MTVMIHYSNSLSGKISKRPIDTVKVDNTVSKMLFDTVVHVFTRVNLDVKQCKTQGYEGSANMSVHKTEFGAKVRKKAH